MENALAYTLKGTKNRLVLYELLPLFLTICFLVIFEDVHNIQFSACNTAAEDANMYVDPFDETLTSICFFGKIFELCAYIAFPYMFLLVLMMSSPLRSAPVMWFCGFKLSSKDDTQKPPSFGKAALFVFFNTHLIPLYVISIWFALEGFEPTLMVSGKAVIISAFLTNLFLLIGYLSKTALTLDERLSGVRIHIAEKLQNRINDKLEKQNRIARILGGHYVHLLWLFITLAFSGFLATNVLRDGFFEPEGYQKVLYERAPVAWEENAVHAMSGLNAPADVKDFYTVGRARAIHYASEFNNLKEKGWIKYIQPVPQRTDTYPEEILEADYYDLRFQADNSVTFQCFYDLSYREDGTAEQCPDISVIQKTIDDNRILYERFNKLPDYRNVSMPDTFIDGAGWKGQDLISLSFLKSADLIRLQSQGHSDKAIKEWLRFHKLYKRLLGEHSNMVEKAVFMILHGQQFSTLEALLYNDPQLAITYQTEINKVILIDSIAETFHADTLLRDDWRVIEPWARATLGMPHHLERKFLNCFKKNKELAALPAQEFPFDGNMMSLCKDLYDGKEGVIGHSLQKLLLIPGEPISNITYQILLGGTLKGQELIGNMHYHMTKSRMVSVALQLISENIPPEKVEDYLQTLPPETYNPLTNEPFAWSIKDRALYFTRSYDPNYKVKFRLNLKETMKDEEQSIPHSSGL